MSAIPKQGRIVDSLPDETGRLSPTVRWFPAYDRMTGAFGGVTEGEDHE
jgi:hypothetical protein